MAHTLLESFGSLLTPDLISRVSAALGESEASTSKTMAAAAPAVLAGMLGKTSDHGAVGVLEGLLESPANDGSLLRNLGSLVGGGSSPMASLGGSLLSQVFGPQVGPVAGALATMGGIKSASATSLLGMVAPIVMSLVGSRMRESGLSLAGLLDGQRHTIQSAVPQALSGILGALSIPGAAHAARAGHGTHPGHVAQAAAAEEPRRMNPVAAVLGLLVVGSALWFLIDRLGARPEPVASSASARVPAASAPAALPSTPWGDLGAFARRVLPNNSGELNIPERGIESKLLAFIEGSAPVDSTTWFDFDRILFDTSAATLRAESDEQIGNIAAILRAFPAVGLKVGGYTDNTGQAAANLQLSQARAETVMNGIVSEGVDAARLTFEGYGDQHPVADNATEEGRQKNRRVSVRVTSK